LSPGLRRTRIRLDDWSPQVWNCDMITQNSGRNTRDDQSIRDTTDQHSDRSIPDKQASCDMTDQNSGPNISHHQSDGDRADDDSDWWPVDRAVAHVEQALHCYREKAVQLVRQAVDDLTLKSRTNPEPRWYGLDVGEGEIFFSDRGKGVVEIFREDLVRFCSQRQ